MIRMNTIGLLMGVHLMALCVSYLARNQVPRVQLTDVRRQLQRRLRLKRRQQPLMMKVEDN